GQVEIANYNSPMQVVISGGSAALERVVAAIKPLRAMKLHVSAPFHCHLMESAARRLGEVIDTLAFHAPAWPVVRNIDARIIESAADAMEGLKRQVRSPVLWTTTIDLMVMKGVTTFVEVGPGNVLSGLIGRIAPQAARFNAGTLEEIQILRETLSRQF
ncbi:ACP S-malonyltransferase, partial [bacterium]|nr:ACP S-malonyltransferase [candidate division CSSED10-310 bacterium]